MAGGAYSPGEIESKWQGYWAEHRTFRAEIDRSRPKYYVLDMFPYPSGDGLHVGHPEGYTASDIVSRYKRMAGFNVLHPMGYDAFGLPAEQFAIKTGTHPKITTEKNINNIRRQIKSLGFSYDWDREIDTTKEKYYRWTQWIFLLLYRRGLAYQSMGSQWWCSKDKTILANEQVIDGRCWRCDTLVSKKELKQWYFRITDYAERLLDDLDSIDWPEPIKLMQRNWVGRSDGARVDFAVASSDEVITVFTTRPDTLFGATYMVLAPEHDLVGEITTDAQRELVEQYIEASARKSERARMADTQTKSGVFTGAMARNPVTGSDIPVWIADYVLASYGTGAIMAVPGHDERDWAFAKTFDLPIVEVVTGGDVAKAAHTGSGQATASGFLDGLEVDEAKRKMIEWLESEGLGKGTVTYKLRDWLFSRQRYWGEPFPVVHHQDGRIELIPESDLPLTLPELEDFRPSGEGFGAPLARVTEWIETTDSSGRKVLRDSNTMPQWAGSCWYFLRFVDPSNDQAAWSEEAEKYWMPVDLYVGGAEHVVLHLLYARFVTMALHDLGHLDFEEPFTRFRAHGTIIREGAKMSKSKGNVIIPDHIIEQYGADTFRTYLMFLGPYQEGGDYQDEGIQGPHGFLHRLYDTVTTALNNPAAADPDVERKLHQTIRQVTRQIPELGYNTSIAAMMEYLNVVRAGGREAVRGEVEALVVMIAPFAPHMAEELWERMGHTESVFDGANWPAYDEAKTQETSVKLAVQVNGKLRATVEGPAGMDQDAAEAAARSDENVARYLDDGTLKRVIYVPNRLLNFVVEQA